MCVNTFYKSVVIFPSLISHRVSKYEIDYKGGQGHDSKSKLLFSGTVWLIVNLTVGCIVFSLSKTYGDYELNQKILKRYHLKTFKKFKRYFAIQLKSLDI